jgi:hypothetical protein
MYLIIIDGKIANTAINEESATDFLLKHFGSDEYNELFQMNFILYHQNYVTVLSKF